MYTILVYHRKSHRWEIILDDSSSYVIFKSSNFESIATHVVSSKGKVVILSTKVKND